MDALADVPFPAPVQAALAGDGTVTMTRPESTALLSVATVAVAVVSACKLISGRGESDDGQDKPWKDRGLFPSELS